MTSGELPSQTPEEVAQILDDHGLHPLADQVRDAARRCRPLRFADPQPPKRPISKGRLLADEGEGVVVHLDLDPPTVRITAALRGGEAQIVAARQLPRLPAQARQQDARTAAAPAEVLVLTVFDPATGAATRPVGAAGVDVADRAHLSWIPLDPDADPWRQRLHNRDGGAPLAERIRYWAEHGNDVTLAAIPIDTPDGDLADNVETAVDRLLTDTAAVATRLEGS